MGAGYKTPNMGLLSAELISPPAEFRTAMSGSPIVNKLPSPCFCSQQTAHELGLDTALQQKQQLCTLKPANSKKSMAPLKVATRC